MGRTQSMPPEVVPSSSSPSFQICSRLDRSVVSGTPRGWTMDASASPIAIRQEIARLRREAEALSSPATFAESAKRARAARALERRLEAQEAAQDGVRRARRGALFKVEVRIEANDSERAIKVFG